MNFNLRSISLYLIYFLPISLITGPAIPDISITLVGILFLIHSFYNKNFFWIKEYWVKAGILFWLMLIILSFFSNIKLQSFIESLIFIRYILLVIALNFWVIKTKKEFKNLLLIILITLSFIILDCLYQFYGYTSFDGYGSDIFGFTSTHYGRLTGPFNQQIPGSHLSRFLFLALIFFNKYIKQSIFSKIFFFIFIFSALYITWLSGETMAIATTFMGIIIYITIINVNKKTFFLAVITFILLLFMTTKNHTMFNDFTIIESTPYHLGLKIDKEFQCINDAKRICKKEIVTNPEFKKVLNNFNKSIYYMIYLDGINMWKDSLFTGIGLSNYEDICLQGNFTRSTKMNYGKCSSHPHNFYLQWLVETGIIGLIFFLFFVFFIYEKIFSNFSDSNVRLGFITLMIVFWPIMSTGSLLKNWYGIEFFFVIGLSILTTKKLS